MQTQINNSDAGRGYLDQLDRYLPAPDDSESSISPSKLLVLGVFIGCLAAAGFLLPLLLAGGSPSAAKQKEPPKQTSVIPETPEIMQTADSQSQTPMKSRPGKHADRSRNTQKARSQNEFKNATTITGPGKTPKMTQYQ